MLATTLSVRDVYEVSGVDKASDVGRAASREAGPKLAGVAPVKAQGSLCLCDDAKLGIWYEQGGTTFENKRLKGIVGSALETVVSESQDNSVGAVALKIMSKLLTTTGSSLSQLAMHEGIQAVQGLITAMAAGGGIGASGATIMASYSQFVITAPLTLSLYFVEASLAKLRYMAEMTKDMPKHTASCALAFQGMVDTLTSNLVDAFSSNMTKMGEFFDASKGCSWRPTKSWGLAGKLKWKFDKDDFNMWGYIVHKLKVAYRDGYKVCEACAGDETCCGAHLLGEQTCVERNCTQVWRIMLTTDFEREYRGFGGLNKYRFAHSWLCMQDGKATSAAASAIYLKRFLAMFSCQFDAWANSEENRRMKNEFADDVAGILAQKQLSKRFIAEVMFNCKKAKVEVAVPDNVQEILRLSVKQ